MTSHREKPSDSLTPSRKRDHVELCVDSNVVFREKTNGFERYSFEHNALPECNLADVTTDTIFLKKKCSMPLLISSMTGGYTEAEFINGSLAEIAEACKVAIGAGSQRQALENDAFHTTFSILRKNAPNIPILANIGAAEIAQKNIRENLHLIIDLIEADALQVHLNPLQELLQPEGAPRFKGVLEGITEIVRYYDLPIFVKEVGAGISATIAKQLLDVGVQGIDVAGAGGTSWAGVELLRNSNKKHLAGLWDWGISTAECTLQCSRLKEQYSFSLIASGGMTNGFEAAKALTLGADMVGIARPFLKTLLHSGKEALQTSLQQFHEQFQATMFLVGAKNLQELRKVPLRGM